MKKIFLIALLLSTPLYAQLAWRIISTPMPYPVYGGQVVYDLASQSSKVYILGGYSELLQREVDWIQEYDVAALENPWRIVGNMLQIRKNFVADVWKNSIMFYGGIVDASSDKYTMEGWNFKTASQPPIVFDRNANFGRALSTGHIVGDKLYVIGGDSLNVSGSSAFPYIVEYNLTTKQTEFTIPFPSASNKPRQHMTFIIADNIYIFGGVFNGVKRTIKKFNIPQRSFSDLTEKLNEARAGGAAVYNPISRKGFIIGGYNETNSALSSVEEVVVGTNNALSITQSTPLNYARTNLMAVNYQGTVIVLGGKDASGKVVPFVEISENKTDVGYDGKIYTEFQLQQNYPNPFNPETVISYQIASAGYVSLKIYNSLGQEVATIVNEYQLPGVYNKMFSAEGKQLPSGVYYYSLRSGNYSSTKKMILIK